LDFEFWIGKEALMGKTVGARFIAPATGRAEKDDKDVKDCKDGEKVPGGLSVVWVVWVL
jgi:hypothetical protein